MDVLTSTRFPEEIFPGFLEPNAGKQSEIQGLHNLFTNELNTTYSYR